MFESLASVSRTINSTLNLDEALRVITREACVLMRARMCSLMMLDESREWLDLRASHGAGEAYLKKPRLSVEESVLGIVVRRKKPIQVENVQTSSRYQNVDLAQREGLISLLSVPLLFAGAGYRHVERLYRETLQFFQRGNPHLCALWRKCRRLPLKRRGSTNASWMWRNSCARTKSCPRSACWPPRWRTKFATRSR